MKNNHASKKFVVSLYDYTLNWVQPYIDAGVGVIAWDKRVEGDILEGFSRLMIQIENAIDQGFTFYGLIAAPPCTEFAVSGARWWEAKSKEPLPQDEDWSKLEYATAYVMIILHLVDLYKPKFWVLENPVGRIESICPEIKPFRNYVFDPCDFGDPYTKKTILWGEFNPNLVKTPVAVTRKNYIRDLGSKNRGSVGSITPPGFSRAFFNANNPTA